MRTKLFILIIGVGLLVSTIPAWAHHAFSAEFDGNKQIRLRGTLLKMDWINPHAWIHLNVKGADGAITTWDIELGPPNALIKRGWNKNSLPPGTELLVEGYLAKDGSNRANGRDITFPDGKKLFAGSSGTGAPDERPEK
jgi:hypothetical protein